jgi:hypothetical protein
MPEVLANHYVLAVHDIRRAADWFIRTLGFAVHNEPPGWIFVKRDNCMIMMGECLDSIPAKDLGDHSYFAYLLVDDADAFYAMALQSGAEIGMKVATKPWAMREFGLVMPEGHRIMVGHRVE